MPAPTCLQRNMSCNTPETKCPLFLKHGLSSTWFAWGLNHWQTNPVFCNQLCSLSSVKFFLQPSLGHHLKELSFMAGRARFPKNLLKSWTIPPPLSSPFSTPSSCLPKPPNFHSNKVLGHGFRSHNPGQSNWEGPWTS